MDQTKVNELSRKVNSLIAQNDYVEVMKITGLTVKEALKKIKPGKSDPVYEFSSDFLKNAPDLFHENLAILLQSYMIHGHVTNSLLTATLVPIVKDKLGDVCSSKNYRSIAISSLILKLIDWIVIQQYGHLFRTNEFQFGFQQFSSTSLCSWMVFEVIDNYLRNGSAVYGCLINCTKAFDTIE